MQELSLADKQQRDDILRKMLNHPTHIITEMIIHEDPLVHRYFTGQIGSPYQRLPAGPTKEMIEEKILIRTGKDGTRKVFYGLSDKGHIWLQTWKQEQNVPPPAEEVEKSIGNTFDQAMKILEMEEIVPPLVPEHCPTTLDLKAHLLGQLAELPYSQLRAIVSYGVMQVQDDIEKTVKKMQAEQDALENLLKEV